MGLFNRHLLEFDLDGVRLEERRTMVVDAEHSVGPNQSEGTGLVIAISVTQKQLAVIEKWGRKLCEELLALDNVKEVCYDDWYGPYIYCMVHEDDERTLFEASEIVERFLEREGCIQQPKA